MLAGNYFSTSLCCTIFPYANVCIKIFTNSGMNSKLYYDILNSQRGGEFSNASRLNTGLWVTGTIRCWRTWTMNIVNYWYLVHDHQRMLTYICGCAPCTATAIRVIKININIGHDVVPLLPLVHWVHLLHSAGQHWLHVLAHSHTYMVWIVGHKLASSDVIIIHGTAVLYIQLQPTHCFSCNIAANITWRYVFHGDIIFKMITKC